MVAFVGAKEIASYGTDDCASGSDFGHEDLHVLHAVLYGLNVKYGIQKSFCCVAAPVGRKGLSQTVQNSGGIGLKC
jgi:hypothetical protein